MAFTEPDNEAMQTTSKSSVRAEKLVDLAWENLSYRVKVQVVDPETGKKVPAWKTIVHPMNGRALGGRVLAIMGPSGAGKTSFINAMCGRVPIGQDAEVGGVAFLNQTVLTAKYKRCISYVAQDDICMAKDTPREALYFSSRCRCGTTEEQAVKDTEEVIARLHLTKAADTILGVPGLIKGVSGGEKKRTNIGSELITNPFLLVLDEPTSGLDSVNAFRVGKLMRELAHDEDRTVMCTIHTPSSELFALFDDLMLMAKGHVIYHGPVDDAVRYFASVGYPVPPRTNPSEFYMNLLQLPEEEVQALWENWDAYTRSTDANANRCLAPVNEALLKDDPVLEKHAQPHRAGAIAQMSLLVGRSWRNAMRDPMITVGRFVQTVFFSILMGLFFFGLDKDVTGVQDRLGFIFMVAMNTVFLAIMPGIATFPPERAVFLMEQANEAYSPWAYFMAKTIAETPFQVVFPIIYISIIYFMADLVNTAAQFFIALFIIVVASNVSFTFGLVAAAFFPTAEMGMAFVPLAVLPMAIVGGLFANTARLEPYWVWLNYVSFIRYIYKGLAVNEFDNIGSLCPGLGADANATVVLANGTVVNATAPKCQYQDGKEVIAFLGFDKDTDTWWMTIIALLIIMIGLRIIGGAVLAYQSSTRTPKFMFEKNVSSRVGSPTRTSAFTPQPSPKVLTARNDDDAAAPGGGSEPAAE